MNYERLYEYRFRDIDQYARKHLHPIREIVDRGGKGWRSHAMVSCIDIVGGSSTVVAARTTSHGAPAKRCP